MVVNRSEIVERFIEVRRYLNGLLKVLPHFVDIAAGVVCPLKLFHGFGRNIQGIHAYLESVYGRRRIRQFDFDRHPAMTIG